MPYHYSRIYNATQDAWANNLAGQDEPEKIWANNNWEENDALVGFYSDDSCDHHNVIFCPPSCAIYVPTNNEKKTFQYGDDELRIPPAILFQELIVIQ